MSNRPIKDRQSVKSAAPIYARSSAVNAVDETKLSFLVPLDAAAEQKTDEQGTEEVDVVNDSHALDDAAPGQLLPSA